MKEIEKEINQLYKEFFEEKKLVSEEKIIDVLKNISNLKSQVSSLQKAIMELGRLLHYDSLLKNNFDFDLIKDFYNQDNETIKRAEAKLYEHLNLNREMMFGYPANMSKDSYLVSYFRWLESGMYLMNSCGDAYHPGNYKMHNAETELAIIEKIKENLGLGGNKYWGYINSGGTEGNFWGLREGITQYKDAVVYVSKDAHYSVAKFLEMVNKVEVEFIDVINGKFDNEKLFQRIEFNYKEYKKPAVLLLTCGTTAVGGVDDVELIKNKLIELKIPHYIHLDAAMYGGIPKNSINSPSSDLFNKLNDLDIDSISISLHKYIGNHKVNGILLAQNQSVDNFVDYIGQRDISILGSRDLAPFSTLQRIKELYDRTPSDEYSKNVIYFENLLKQKGISYLKGDKNGNTFVIKKPSERICQKYQLATFTHNDIESAHIIIFPYHTHKSMNDLLDEIISENN